MDIDTAMHIKTAMAAHSVIDDRLRAALAAHALVAEDSATSLTGIATAGPGPGDDDDEDDDDDRPGGDVGNIDPDDDEGYDDDEDDDDEEPLQVRRLT